jgi:hypothetical protein
MDGSRNSTPATIEKSGRTASAAREISRNFPLSKLASFIATSCGMASSRRTISSPVISTPSR